MDKDRKIRIFARLLADDMLDDTPDAMQFYSNNSEAIEKELLKVKSQRSEAQKKTDAFLQFFKQKGLKV